jgi:hypothetical protein
MKKTWTKPEVKIYRGTVVMTYYGIDAPVSARSARQLIRAYNTYCTGFPGIRLAPSIFDDIETCADYCKATACSQLLLKDDPRCRTKLGG